MMQDQSIARGALRRGAGALAGAALLVGAGAGTASAANSFTISGSPSQVLLPGLSEPLTLSIGNPAGGLLTVSSLNVAITGVHPVVAGADCTLDNFAVTQYSGPFGLVIPGSTSLTLSVLGIALGLQPQITMRETGVNQDACQGATLDLAYTGTGTAADGTPVDGSGGDSGHGSGHGSGGSGSDGSDSGGSDSDGDSDGSGSDSDGSSSGSTGQLADTGGSGHSTEIALAGGVLAALGAGGVYVARRRKEQS